MNKRKYEYYVATDCWKRRRATYLAKHDCCEVCGRAKEMDVHHLSYFNLGEELDDDLLAVCRGCHALIHGEPGATELKFAIMCLGSRLQAEKEAGLKSNPKHEGVFEKLRARLAA